MLVRLLGGVTGKGWRIALPFSGVLQLAAFGLFIMSVRRHRPDSAGKKPEVWMRLVFAGTILFLVALIAKCALLFRQSIVEDSPALPHLTDQQFVVLAVWGVLVPTIWGFNARWLPIFLGLRQPRKCVLYAAYDFAWKILPVSAIIEGEAPLACAPLVWWRIQ